MAEKEFPHMGNAGFPGTENVNVYAYENTFDYTRWQPDVVITCTNVSWDSEYRNVPYFATDANRDTWFANQAQTYRQTLEVETHLLPDGSIKLPIPFPVLSKYNYLYAKFPIFTSETQPIGYENANNRTGTWFFFITDVQSIAPNTTRAVLQLDVWTTFINSCEVSYMMLERGHWPVANTNVETYLQEPIFNNSLLLADDVNFGGEARNVSTINQIVFNDTNMYAVFVCSGNPTSSASWGNWDNSLVPTINDETADNPHVSTGHYYMRQGVPSYDAFAIAVADLNNFLTTVDSQIPQFKQTVQCVFFANEKLITIGDSRNFCGYTIYDIYATQGSNNLLRLTKDMFNYPTEYNWFAKLYTYPYSHIEITNGNGDVTQVRIEDTTGNIQAKTALSIAFPAIKLDCVLTGINGSDRTVTFTNINERSFSFGGDWYKTFKEWDIPTFGVVLSPGDDYDVHSYYDRVQRDNDRATTKGNAERSATATRKISKANAANTETNSKIENNLQYGNISGKNGNVKRRARRTRRNTENTAAANYSNAKRNWTMQRNVNGSDQAISGAGVTAGNGTNQNRATDINTEVNNLLLAQTGSNLLPSITSDYPYTDNLITEYGITNIKGANDARLANIMQAVTTNLETDSLAATSFLSGASQAANSIITGAISGSIAEPGIGTAAGLAAGAAGAIITASTQAASVGIIATKNATLAQASINANEAYYFQSANYNIAMGRFQRKYNLNVKNIDNNAAKEASRHLINAEYGNAKEIYGTLDTSSQSNSGVITWNAYKTQETENTIATNTYDRRIEQYENSKSNADTNADTTYNASVNNATDISDNTTKAIRNARRQGRMNAPKIYGQMKPDKATVRPIALYATVVTQPKGAIQAAAHQFYRYGYYLHQQANASSLSLMEHFTYWKAEEIWIVGEGVPEIAQERIMKAFKDGVTVWDNPNEIGTISITSNTLKES